MAHQKTESATDHDKAVKVVPAAPMPEVDGEGECDDLLQAAIRAQNQGMFPDLAGRLRREVRLGRYNELAAYTLAVASGWAYAEDDGLARVMKYLGFGYKVGKQLKVNISTERVQNDALLVKTTASFMRAGKVGILCFRGTEPTNALEWLSNMSFEPERFYSAGDVHSGFYRNLRVVLPWMQVALAAGIEHQPVPRVRFLPVRAKFLGGDEAPIVSLKEEPLKEAMRETLQQTLREDLLKEELEPLQDMESLLITGHSLGAALAVLAAATIFMDPAYACYRDKVVGVYAFGQPLIGSKAFCESCNHLFGDRVFRHVYGNDVVPRLPPTLYGDFYTFGQEYVSTEDGWTRKLQAPGEEVERAGTLVGSALPAVFAWYVNKVPFLTGTPDTATIARLVADIPLLHRVPGAVLKAVLTMLREMIVPKVSIDDHQPYKYIDCSLRSVPRYT